MLHGNLYQIQAILAVAVKVFTFDSLYDKYSLIPLSCHWMRYCPTSDSITTAPVRGAGHLSQLLFSFELRTVYRCYLWCLIIHNSRLENYIYCSQLSDVQKEMEGQLLKKQPVHFLHLTPIFRQCFASREGERYTAVCAIQ